MSFEAQKITFLGIFGREYLKFRKKLAPKFEKFTENCTKIRKKWTFLAEKSV